MLLVSNPVSSRRSRHDMQGRRCKVYWIYMCDCVDIVQSVAAWWWWWILKLNMTGLFRVAFESNPRSPVDWSKMLETAVLLEIGNVPAVAGAASTCFGLEAGDLAVVAVATTLECGALPMAPKLPDELGKRFILEEGSCKMSFISCCCSVLATAYAARFSGRLCPDNWATIKSGTPFWHSCVHIVRRTLWLLNFPSVSPALFTARDIICPSRFTPMGMSTNQALLSCGRLWLTPRKNASHFASDGRLDS